MKSEGVEGATSPPQPAAASAPRTESTPLSPDVLEPETKGASRQSVTAIVLNLVKCSVGAGSFALPWAVGQVGWLPTTIGFAVFWVLTVVTILQLAWIEEELWKLIPRGERRKREQQGQRLSYPELAAIAMPWAAVDCSCICKRHVPPASGDMLSVAEAHRADAAADGSKRGGGEEGEGTSDGDAVARGRAASMRRLSRSARDTLDPNRPAQVNIMAVVSAVGIVATAVGVGAAYVDFVTTVVSSTLPLNALETAAIMLPIVLLFTVLGRLDILAYTSALGNIAVATGIIAVVVYGAEHQGSDSIPLADGGGVGAFVGTTSFLFAIHIIALPVIEGVPAPRRKAGVNIAFALVSVINFVFAIVAAALIGRERMPSNVVNYLADGSVALLVVKFLLVVDLIATMPVVLLAAVRVIERALFVSVRCAAESRSNSRHAIVLAVRTAVVAASFGIAFAVPDFGQLVSIVGGVVSCMMGFVLPPILHIAVARPSTSLAALPAIVIAVLGVAAMVLTLATQLA